MEQNIFSWKGWDQIDTTIFQFTDCVFKKDFGSIRAGEYFEGVLLDYETGTLTAQNGPNEISVKFDLVPK